MTGGERPAMCRARAAQLRSPVPLLLLEHPSPSKPFGARQERRSPARGHACSSSAPGTAPAASAACCSLRSGKGRGGPGGAPLVSATGVPLAPAGWGRPAGGLRKRCARAAAAQAQPREAAAPRAPRAKATALRTVGRRDVEERAHGASRHVGLDPTHALLHILLRPGQQAACGGDHVGGWRAWSRRGGGRPLPTGQPCLLGNLRASPGSRATYRQPCSGHQAHPQTPRTGRVAATRRPPAAEAASQAPNPVLAPGTAPHLPP